MKKKKIKPRVQICLRHDATTIGTAWVSAKMAKEIKKESATVYGIIFQPTEMAVEYDPQGTYCQASLLSVYVK